ncbi:hypothetical protein CSIM01_01559 [Colletotrichum simmondsii]|uniref:Uncharacterized protein n=1 Tax=Colletotrichum simmondsii TaxID=703756 RepID=A0A135TR96_9PEZI|nr:hypothetical protein CSIM01_01559 [Colletotrichum simmondsii]
MPTIIKPRDVVVGNCTEKPSQSRDFYQHFSFQNDVNGRGSVQTSISDAEKDTIVAFKNGFIITVLRAWEQHLHLELRSDEVWLAIIVQFSFFVNKPGRAEALRDRFVVHEGIQDLVVFVDRGVTAQTLTYQH